MKKIVVSILFVLLSIQMFAINASAAKKIELILDWVPNTNHTGLYVAQEKGFFEEIGVDVMIRRPPEGSTTELVGLGQAQFGISFQDSLAHRLVGDLPVTAVAAILEHNTSGILAKESTNIHSPKDMEGFSYGTWNDPTELAMLKYIVEGDGGDYSKIKLVPNQADNSVVGLANNMFDSAWIYYAWDGILAEHQNVATNFFYLKDYAKELDYYSPVIIANNDYLANNQAEAKAVIQAIKKGYQYAVENPEEAADLLIANAPELKDQKEFVLTSQKWINQHYAENMDSWGHIDETRWNTFYEWLVEHDLVDKKLLEKQYFSNELLSN